MNTLKMFAGQQHGKFTVQRNINANVVRIPRALAARIVELFVYQFSERPLRECSQLMHCDWRTIERMGDFELGHAVTWISKLLDEDESRANDADAPWQPSRLPEIQKLLAALKGAADGFPVVQVVSPEPARRAKRRKPN